MVIVHDVAHLVLKDIFKSASQQFYARAMFTQVRRRAAAVAFVSRFTEGEFHRVVGQPVGRTRVIHNGIGDDWFNIDLGKSDGKPVRTIVYVGNIKPHKNLGRLLSAFDLVCHEIPHNLLLVGKREGFVTGENSIAGWSQKLGDRIHFTGEVSDARIREIVRAADALVLPSLYEGFGLPPIEAMAAECPTLVSNAGSLPEICGDAALYCDPMSVTDIAVGLKRIVTDNGLRSSLKARGLLQAHQFKWQTASTLYAAMMEDVMEKRRNQVSGL